MVKVFSIAALALIAILLFMLVFFVHELGHFFVAKFFGVKVNEFAVGMGPKVLEKQGKATKFTLRALPIGGYCALEGEEGSTDPAAFCNAKLWHRSMIIAAGAMMNIVLAITLMMVILSGERWFASTEISRFAASSVSSSQGLMVGDKIIKVNGYRVRTFTDISFVLATSEGAQVDFEVRRGKDTVEFPVTFNTYIGADGKRVLVRDFFVTPVEKNFRTFLWQTFAEIGSNVRLTYASLVGMLTGRFQLTEVTGVIGMGVMVSGAVNAGLQESFISALSSVLMVMMIVSVSTGVLNLLPFPALDGGRLVFLGYEGIFRRRPNPRFERAVNVTGFLLLMLLMVVVALNDIRNLFSRR